MLTSIVLILAIVATIIGAGFLAHAVYDFMGPLRIDPLERHEKQLRYRPWRRERIDLHALAFGGAILFAGVLLVAGYFGTHQVEPLNPLFLSTGLVAYGCLGLGFFFGYFKTVPLYRNPHGSHELIRSGTVLAVTDSCDSLSISHKTFVSTMFGVLTAFLIIIGTMLWFV